MTKDIKLFSILIILITFYSVNQWSNLPIGNEYFWWFIFLIFLNYLIKFKKLYTSVLIEKNFIYLNIYIYWCLICIIRGFLVFNNYWQLKNLISTSFFLLLPLIVYLSNSIISIQIILKNWFNYALIIFIFYFKFLFGDAIGKYLMPSSFLILFFPILKNKWKFILIFILFFVIFYDFSARSNIIKFIVPFFLSFFYYFKNLLTIKILNTIRLILLFIPIILFLIASFGIFNIFKINDYIGDPTVSNINISNKESEIELTVDTRTDLYYEVINSAIKNNYFIFGRTPARGNDSNMFGEYLKNHLKTGINERFSNEVSILNIFTWLGLVGVILYFLIFYRASYISINQSNNIFSKLIGLNISFRWFFSFIEDFSVLDLSNIFLWIMIGLAYSKTFRQMNNYQIKNWLNKI